MKEARIKSLPRAGIRCKIPNKFFSHDENICLAVATWSALRTLGSLQAAEAEEGAWGIDCSCLGDRLLMSAMDVVTDLPHRVAHFSPPTLTWTGNN